MALPLPHPVITTSFNQILLVIFLAYTSSRSPSRVLGFIPVCILTCLAQIAYTSYITSPNWWTRSFPAIFWVQPFLYTDRLFCRGWQYGKDHVGPTDVPPEKSRNLSRLAWAQQAFDGPRGLGTTWEVKNAPHFDSQNPSYVPPQKTFILRHVISVAMSYLVAEAMAQYLSSISKANFDMEYGPLFARRGDITADELILRAKVTVVYWTLMYCWINFVYSICACLAAILKPSDIRYWRPIFGPWLSGYTLRGFWGKFWHQVLRGHLVNPANSLVHSILGLPRGSLLGRYLVLFLVFAQSGFSHIFADYGSLTPSSEGGTMHFFCCQAFGIMFEDAVLALYRCVCGERRAGRTWKFLAMGWVVMWLVWTSPAWIYLHLRYADEKSLSISVGGIWSLVENLFQLRERD